MPGGILENMFNNNDNNTLNTNFDVSVQNYIDIFGFIKLLQTLSYNFPANTTE